MTSSIGIRMPVMPTGMASETQITQAQITTARQAMPAGDRPLGVGRTNATSENTPQASAKPRSVVLGFLPDSTMLSRNLSHTPLAALRSEAPEPARVPVATLS